jgi:adenine-specific DNA-methyltransferase
LFGYQDKVDCIYIDPPYNTGARDWKYNNDYVDEADRWRHSKWLSMMEKRLRLAERLLTRDGVLIVTIDEHEVENLGLLLRQTLKRVRDIQLVTIVTNTAGSMSPDRFSRAEEYAYFCFFGNSKPSPMETDFLAESRPTTQFWFPLFRSRGLNDRPSRRPNLVYPIAIDSTTLQITGVGSSLKDRVEAGEVSGDLDEWQPDLSETVDGNPVIWPILDTGELTTWQLNTPTLIELAAEGFVRVRARRKSDHVRPFAISYVKAGNRKRIRNGEVVVAGRERNGAYILEGGRRTTIPKSTWKVASHDARLNGTTMLRALLGQTNFSYPKSPYATADAIMTVVADKQDAVILDFFAGSGTTLQSVAMLNARDDGNRRCILVTNNEVAEDLAAQLAAKGLAPGDPEFEARGICKAITIPRVRATLTGLRPDGKPAEGQYLDGTEIADGFDQNAVFFDVAYEDPNAIEVGQRLDKVLPALWLVAGCIGNPTNLKPEPEWLLSDDVPFAVLLDEDHFKGFARRVRDRDEVTHVWLVTDSTSAFARMRERLPEGLTVGMLYRDYLRNFRMSTGPHS